MKHYFTDIESIYQTLDTSEDGLDQSQAQLRLDQYGKNKLAEGKKKTLVKKFVEQLTDPMIIVLIGAAIISGAVGEIADAVIILTVVVLNAVLSVYQEGKAEKAIEELQKMTSPYSKLRRNGEVVKVKSEEIVPGDIVLLEAGDAVPADMRLIEGSSLKIEEASLTGESVPAEKFARTIEADADTDEVTLGDRFNMAYLGTSVVYGRGEGIVVGTGMLTEMGKIAGIISNVVEEKTPLQIKLAGLSRVLSVGVLGICVFIFVYGVMSTGGLAGGHLFEMFLTAVSLAVAAIPEGLVAVVTVVLSVGVTRMSKKNAIIRRLTAVETLGCTQIICSDKTGTLTQNKMTVVDVYGDPWQLAVSMALCNDAALSEDGQDIIGEPTECALVQYALSNGIKKKVLITERPRVLELPFDSDRKMMSTVHQAPNGKFVQYTKGAPDELLKACTQMLTSEGQVVFLDDKLRQQIMTENKRMADRALRVLGSAMKEIDQLPSRPSSESMERKLTFIGLVGMIDPVRPEVQPAIDKCRRAGIRPIMITGDHKDTAVAIGKELGIINHEGEAITGAELAKLSDHELETRIQDFSIYARVQPEHKVRIVNAWKKRGKITAMTGDGVNDAPALKSADIGVGMGITGTDVSKSVSDMVLADDNFASIVYAVEEGRRIYENLQKAIQFLLSSNLSEVIAIFIATTLGFRLLYPIHILWINLITDTFPAIALGMEEAEEDIMEKEPRDPKESIFANGVGSGLIYQGILIAALTLGSYAIGAQQSQAIGVTMAFLTMSLCEVFHSINMRSRTKSIFRLKTHNIYLFGAMMLSFLLTVTVVYLPGLNTVFRLVALSANNFLLATGLSLAIIPLVEMVKLVSALRRKKH